MKIQTYLFTCKIELRRSSHFLIPHLGENGVSVDLPLPARWLPWTHHTSPKTAG